MMYLLFSPSHLSCTEGPEGDACCGHVQKTAKIIRRELQREQINDLHILPKDVKRILEAIYHQRKKALPKLPPSRLKTYAMLAHFEVRSSRGENMLHVNDVVSGTVIFTTDAIMALLSKKGVKSSCDGTFKVCPRFFDQLCTIHAFKNGQCVQCAFYLLPTK